MPAAGMPHPNKNWSSPRSCSPKELSISATGAQWVIDGYLLALKPSASA